MIKCYSIKLMIKFIKNEIIISYYKKNKIINDKNRIYNKK